MAAILIPAYGNDYKTAALVLAAWEAGADFIDEEKGEYVNKDDINECLIRFDNLSRLCSVRTT